MLICKHGFWNICICKSNWKNVKCLWHKSCKKFRGKFQKFAHILKNSPSLCKVNICTYTTSLPPLSHSFTQKHKPWRRYRWNVTLFRSRHSNFTQTDPSLNNCEAPWPPETGERWRYTSWLLILQILSK